MIKFIKKKLRNNEIIYNFINNLILDYRALKREGFRSISTVSMPDGGGRMYINRTDRRGLRLYRKGLMDRDLVRHWLGLDRVFQPTLVIDVGANYGEFCVSLGAERDGLKVFVIEANPAMSRYLEKSVKSHNYSDKFELIYKAVSNEVGRKVKFEVQSDWTGTSTMRDIAYDEVDNRYNYIELETETIDSIVNRSGFIAEVLMFKIDVEGAETEVVEGFLNTLKKSKSYVGIIEFSPKALTDHGASPEVLLSMLLELGVVCFLKENRAFMIESIEDCDYHRGHRDLINLVVYSDIPMARRYVDAESLHSSL